MSLILQNGQWHKCRSSYLYKHTYVHMGLETKEEEKKIHNDET